MEPRTRRRMVGASAFVILSLVCSARVIQSRTETVPPGMMPYTPTRLDWLVLNLEAYNRNDFSSDSDYSLGYVAKNPDTVVIHVYYLPKASAGIVDRAIDTAKQLANQEASRNGWSPWVKVEVQRKLLEEANR